MSQSVLFHPGAIGHLGEILDRGGSGSVLMVTGKSSYTLSGAASRLAPIIAGRLIVRFDDFEPNPRLADVERGVEIARGHGFSRILAVGGGSVLDTAKLIGIFSAQDAPPRAIALGRRPIDKAGPPLVACPTTAGSGSEATHFAALYIESEKVSVAHESMLPTHAVVDPELTMSLPPRTTAVTGLDAFAQAVESMWSVHATPASSAYAAEAVRLAFENLHSAVHRPSPEARRAMAMASHLSGKAINITKTTAPHAISYTMTSRFGVPHGLAVALTLAPVLLYNSEVSDDDAAPGRRADDVRRAIAEVIRLLGCRDAAAAARRIDDWIRSLGLPNSLAEVGIRSTADRRLLVESVNRERLAGNPRRLPPDALEELLRRCQEKRS